MFGRTMLCLALSGVTMVQSGFSQFLSPISPINVVQDPFEVVSELPIVTVPASGVPIQPPMLSTQQVYPSPSDSDLPDFSPDDPNLGEWRQKISDAEKAARQKTEETNQAHQEVQKLKTEQSRYLFEARINELGKLKSRQKPDLTVLGLDVFNLPELDGSTSCLNLGKIAITHILQIPYSWTWETPEDMNRRSGGYQQPRFRRIFPPREGYWGGYNNNNNNSPFLQVEPTQPETNFRQRNIFKDYFGHFQGTHEAYLGLIGPSKTGTTNQGYVNNLPHGTSAFPASEIILVARRPSKDEKIAAVNADVELDVRPVALDAFVFFVHRKNHTESLTVEQLQSIYANPAVTNWKDFGWLDHIITPYERNRNSGSRELMDELVVTEEAVKKYSKSESPSLSPSLHSYSAVNSNQVFREQRQIADSGGGMRGPFVAASTNPYSIAYSVYHYEHFMVNVPETRLLAINGVRPDYETIRMKKYPLVSEVYVVTRKGIPEDSPAAKLRNWLLSDDGQRCIRESGYVPVNPDIAKGE